jgi:acetyl esterase/lipase
MSLRTGSPVSPLRFAVVAAGFVIASSALAAAAAPSPAGTGKAQVAAPRIPADLRIRKDIVFKATPSGSSEVLDLWFFEPLVQKYPRAPLVVYSHGGAWGGGDKLRVFRADTIEVIRELNRQGIASATIEYRLANGGAATTYNSAADCKDAVRFLAKNAARFGLDPTRIGILGGSAGGHLALVTALGADADYPCDPTLNDSGATIRCVAAYYPATTFLHPATMKGSNFERPQRLVPILGGTLEEKRAIAVKLSPVELVQPGSPPIFLAHGDNDTVLSHRHSLQLRDLAAQCGVPVECIISHGAGHGLRGDAIDPSVAEINRRTVAFFLKYLAAS